MKARLWLSFAMLATSTPAFACGACDEDRIASTYDHAVIARAVALHHVVVFAAISGQGSTMALAAKAKRAAGHVPGVDRASVRSAAEPGPALSFALDSRALTPERALDAIARKSAHKGIKLTLLKVMP